MSLALTENITAKLKQVTHSVWLDRSSFVQKTAEILSREDCSCPILVGESGAGKTTSLYQLAHFFIEHAASEVVQMRRLDIDELELRTQDQFFEQLERVLLAAQQPTQPTVLFLDDIDHFFLRCPEKIAGFIYLLNQSLSTKRAKLGLICCSDTFYGYFQCSRLKRYIEPLFFSHYGEEELVFLLKEKIQSKRQAKLLDYDEAFLKLVIVYAKSYLSDSVLPGSALSLLDKIIAQALINENKTLKDYIYSILAGWYGVHLTDIAYKNPQKLGLLAQKAQEKIVGQHTALHQIQNTASLFSVEKGLQAFVFFGEEGVGKTTTALLVHDFFYGFQVKPSILDLSFFSREELVQSIISSLKKQKQSSFIFLNAATAEPALKNDLAKFVFQGCVSGFDGYQHDLNEATFFFIYDKINKKDSEEFNVFSVVDSSVDSEEEKLQFITPDILNSGMRELASPIHHSGLTTNQVSSVELPKQLLKKAALVCFQPLSFLAKEQMVELFLQAAAKKLVIQHGLFLLYSPELPKKLLYRFNWSHAKASEIESGFQEQVLLFLVDRVSEIPQNIKKICLEISPQDGLELLFS